MVMYDGNSTFTLDNNELYNLPAGTYYFIVSTMNANQYSNTAKYYLNISACPKSNDSNIAGYWISGNWKSLFEFTLGRVWKIPVFREYAEKHQLMHKKWYFFCIITEKLPILLV